MLLRFNGTYTGGRTSITLCGVTFEGRTPSEVTDAEGIRRLSNHPEFEAVVEDSEPAPKKRGRPRKVEAE
jgi:hypothetical protein